MYNSVFCLESLSAGQQTQTVCCAKWISARHEYVLLLAPVTHSLSAGCVVPRQSRALTAEFDNTGSLKTLRYGRDSQYSWMGLWKRTVLRYDAYSDWGWHISQVVFNDLFISWNNFSLQVKQFMVAWRKRACKVKQLLQIQHWKSQTCEENCSN